MSYTRITARGTLNQGLSIHCRLSQSSFGAEALPCVSTRTMRVCFLSLHDHGHYDWAEEGILFDFLNASGPASGAELSVKEVPWASAAELALADDAAFDAASRDCAARWAQHFDVICVRTTWDYQEHGPRFLRRLAQVAATGIAIANAPDVIRWNFNKLYLLELERHGADIVPTVWCAPSLGSNVEQLTAGNDEAEMHFLYLLNRIRLTILAPLHFCKSSCHYADILRSLPARLSAAEFVCKPLVSAGADDTYRMHSGSADFDAQCVTVAARYADARGWMAQAFLSTIEVEGEYSLMYFDGIFSHAVQKVPKSGDFRVQTVFGGTTINADAAARDGLPLRAAADRVMAALHALRSARAQSSSASAGGSASSQASDSDCVRPPLQARVDLVRDPQSTREEPRFWLMELELIEPCLYMTQSAGRGPENFVAALRRQYPRD